MCKRYKQVFHRETRNVLRLALIWGAMPGLHCCAGSSLAVAGGGGYSQAAVWGLQQLQILALFCFAACGILPDQGCNPCLLHWQVDSSPLSHQGSPRNVLNLDCVSVKVLVVILSQSSATCYHWGPLGKGYRCFFSVLFLVSTCDSKITSKGLIKKKNNVRRNVIKNYTVHDKNSKLESLGS